MISFCFKIQAHLLKLFHFRLWVWTWVPLRYRRAIIITSPCIFTSVRLGGLPRKHLPLWLSTQVGGLSRTTKYPPRPWLRLWSHGDPARTEGWENRNERTRPVSRGRPLAFVFIYQFKSHQSSILVCALIIEEELWGLGTKLYYFWWFQSQNIPKLGIFWDKT